jgi:hypothetical protein
MLLPALKMKLLMKAVLSEVMRVLMRRRRRRGEALASLQEQ